jgi:hypothetical protein
MPTIKASIGVNNANALQTKIKRPDNIRATAVAIGARPSLNDLSNVDMSLLEQGAMLVYDATAGLWRAKQTLEDGTSFEGGHY